MDQLRMSCKERDRFKVLAAGQLACGVGWLYKRISQTVGRFDGLAAMRRTLSVWTGLKRITRRRLIGSRGGIELGYRFRAGRERGRNGR